MDFRSSSFRRAIENRLPLMFRFARAAVWAARTGAPPWRYSISTRQTQIGVRFAGGFLDHVDVEQSGIVLLTGWTEDGRLPDLVLSVNGESVKLTHWFELDRSDLVGNRRGFGAEYRGPQSGSARELVITQGQRQLARVSLDLPLYTPDYDSLFDEQRVLHREDIYGSGPPYLQPNLEVLRMARSLPAPILDLGCGSGALVRALRGDGVEAYGIELRRPEIVASIRDDVAPYITLYDGAFPLPFKNGRFGSVVCSEVLEHIVEFQTAVWEIVRLAQNALVTVPDISAIPRLFPHRVVPWHLLEATQVNFITQSSLECLLAKSFATVTFSRLGRFEVNGSSIFTNLVARCKGNIVGRR
jgi:SAM-dependent methyltransferase